MSDNGKNYVEVDPYKVDLDSAQDMLSALQDLLWYDKNGKIDEDKELDHTTLEAVLKILSPLSPRKREAEPCRLTKFSVTVLTPMADGEVTQKKLAELLLLSEMHAEKRLPRDSRFAITASLVAHRVDMPEEEVAPILCDIGYPQEHFKKE